MVFPLDPPLNDNKCMRRGLCLLISILFPFFCFTRNEIYIAPSGVQKERIQPEDLFIQTIQGEDILTPPEYKKY